MTAKPHRDHFSRYFPLFVMWFCVSVHGLVGLVSIFFFHDVSAFLCMSKLTRENGSTVASTRVDIVTSRMMCKSSVRKCLGKNMLYADRDVVGIFQVSYAGTMDLKAK